MIISLQKYASNMLIIFCRMALPHLLEHYYEENHRGRRIAAGEVIGFAGLSLFSTMLYCTNEQFAFVQVLPLLRPRTHDRFLEMRYDDRYTPLLQRAGLDVVSYQVRRGLPEINPAAITTLVDRYKTKWLLHCFLNYKIEHKLFVLNMCFFV